MNLKKFEIRWNDLDANRHLANSAYVVYMSDSRMNFLTENGLDIKTLAEHDLGPVVFHEHMYYYKESQGGTVRVSAELDGLSEDGMFFRFVHYMYDEAGMNMAYSEVQGGFINLKSRSLTSLPVSLNERWKNAPKTNEFKILTKADMRTPGKSPVNL